MNPLIEQFKRDVESLDRSFPDIFHLPKNGMSVWLEESYTNQIKSHYTQSLLNLITKMIEECEGRKKEITCIDDGSITLCERCDMNIPYNWALSDTISKLKEFRKYLEELKK